MNLINKIVKVQIEDTLSLLFINYEYLILHKFVTSQLKNSHNPKIKNVEQ